MQMKMKVLTILGLALILFTGCGNKDEQIAEAMESYVRDYYETYIAGKGYGIDIPEITVTNLKAATQRDYDMSLFEDCTDTSYAVLNIDDEENIISVDLHMNCK